MLDAAPLVACVLATYLAHSTLLLGAAEAASRAGLFAGARAQDALWKGALASGLLTAAVASATGGGPVTWGVGAALPVGDGAALASAPAVGAGVSTLAPTSVLGPVEWAGVVVGLWAVVAVVAVARRLWARARWVRALGPRRAVGDAALAALAGEVGRAAGVQVRLTVSDALLSPVALGAHEVVLPRRALGLDRRALRALVAHEVAHLARRDPPWLVACALVEGVLWVQPLNRLARRRMQTAAESLCDAWAATHSDRPTDLARCLVEVASWGLAPAPVAVAGMAVRPGALEGRVRAVLDGRAVAPVRRAHAALAVAAAVAVGWAGPGVSPSAASGLGAVGESADGLSVLDPVVRVDGGASVRLHGEVVGQGNLALRVPGLGRLVVLGRPLDLGLAPAGAFDGRTLRLRVDGRSVEVESEVPLVSGGPAPAYAFVLPDGGDASPPVTGSPYGLAPLSF